MAKIFEADEFNTIGGMALVPLVCRDIVVEDTEWTESRVSLYPYKVTITTPGVDNKMTALIDLIGIAVPSDIAMFGVCGEEDITLFSSSTISVITPKIIVFPY